MNLQIKWRKPNQEWKEAAAFPVEDIIDKSRNHTIDLFSRDTLFFVIKQGADIIISNDKELRHQYHKKRFKVFTLDQIERSEGILKEVGFV